MRWMSHIELDIKFPTDDASLAKVEKFLLSKVKRVSGAMHKIRKHDYFDFPNLMLCSSGASFRKWHNRTKYCFKSPVEEIKRAVKRDEVFTFTDNIELDPSIPAHRVLPVFASMQTHLRRSSLPAPDWRRFAPTMRIETDRRLRTAFCPNGDRAFALCFDRVRALSNNAEVGRWCEVELETLSIWPEEEETIFRLADALTEYGLKTTTKDKYNTAIDCAAGDGRAE